VPIVVPVKVPIDHLEPPALRTQLDRYLVGHGLELGPGHVPYPVPPGAAVRLVDQWTPDANRVLFYELPDDTTFPQPDLVANLDLDRLQAVQPDSQDFVIASHILEHLAEPIGMLADIHRVLRPGGVLLLLLPDRRRTFDQNRFGTGLAHVVSEHERGVSIVDDEHIVDFLVHADHLIRRQEGVDPEPITPELIEAHRLRSIHAHCWTEDEFLDVLLYCARELGLGFRLVDGLSSRAGRGSWEFGFVLTKVDPRPDPTEEILAAWQAIVARQDLSDRWPIGLVVGQVLDEVEPLSPRQVGVLIDVIELVLERADLRRAFATGALQVEAAVRWAAGVATGATEDTSTSRLRVHADVLADWERWLVPRARGG
jgi:SAM-dependent methyltransferase